jgi:hypothetical protein
MWYIVNTGSIEVSLTDSEKIELIENRPQGLTCSDSQSHVTLQFEGEGFDLADYQNILARAVKPGLFVVRCEDQKGEDQYYVEYGPGFCEEE